MWDIQEIKKKKDYVVKRLTSDNIKDEEKLKLQCTLAIYLEMIKNADNLIFPKLPKFINLLIKNKYVLKKEKKYEKYLKNWDTFPTVYMKELYFLIDLILTDEDILFEKKDYITFSTNLEDMIKIVDNFYKTLGDEEIYKYAQDILKKESNLNFTTHSSKKRKNICGETYQDFIFDDVYINIYKKDNLVDFIALAHEVMHGIDFKFQKKLIFDYNGFVNEIPAYTINLLFINYLKKIKNVEKEANKLERMFFINFYSKKFIITEMLQNDFYESHNRNFNLNDSKKSIVDAINPSTVLELIKFKSLIVSYGLYKQILQKKEKGLDNLKKYMKNGIGKNDKMDFSFIELSNNDIMILYKEMMDIIEEMSIKKQKNI